jgi:hypothetical protein
MLATIVLCILFQDIAFALVLPCYLCYVVNKVLNIIEIRKTIKH